ncbi:MAG: NADPH-dependent 7-cyano-7-deazaguanine reductase QueF [Rickettsiales bacterium]|nr:MAG: NADPH-dependent 7-cyano-7-deazaguanine reductase QueF [Rickettsiales bacterium]
MNLHLGKESQYLSQYDKNLLESIPRKSARDDIGIKNAEECFSGYDLWNCYEFSWLNQNGKPEVRIIKFEVSCQSEFIVESKSVKLYLNSFHNTRFKDEKEILTLLTSDLNEYTKSIVNIEIFHLNHFAGNQLHIFPGICLDEIDIETDIYHVDSSLLKLSNENITVEEELYSNLLKSNCLVTKQPDWASIYIKYKGVKIDHNHLLKYIISFRNHNEFHEQCIEHIYKDIIEICSPEELFIYAKYTRRGGIDINPYRTNMRHSNILINKLRDIRQ